MKQYIRRMIGLVSVVALLCAGCAKSSSHASPKNISVLPEYEKLSSIIGCTLDDAIEKMGWQVDEVEPFDELRIDYKTPLTVEYAGVSFRVWLSLQPSVQKIIRIDYHAEYQNAPDTAAKEILQVAQKLGTAMGQDTEAALQDLDIDIFETTEAQLQETLEKESMKMEIHWDLSEVADTSIKDFMTELKDSKSWQLYTERGWPPQYRLAMTISHIEETDTVYLLLGLCVEPDVSQ